MDIPSYQIHNILRDYANQLRKRMHSSRSDSETEPGSAHRISAPEKRRRVQERVTAEIVERIVHLDLEESRSAAAGTGKESTEEKIPVKREFVYHILTPSHLTQVCRLTLERSEDLIRRFEESRVPKAKKD